MANSYNPAPGPQNPGKYPFTGSNYAKYGEQQGFIYNPYKDQYQPDPKVAKEYGESSGLIEPEPKPPGLFDSLAPVAGTVGAIYGAKALAPQLVGNLATAGTATAPGVAGSGLLGAAQDFLGFGPDASSGAGGLLGGGVTDPTITTGAELMPGGIASQAVEGIGPLADGAAYADSLNPGVFDAGFWTGTDIGAGPAGQVLQGNVGLGNALGVAGGLYGAYNLIDNWGQNTPLSGAMSGAAVGTAILPGVGTAIGAGVGGLIGMFDDHKSTKEYQQERWGDIAEDPNVHDYWKQTANLRFQQMQGTAEGGTMAGEGGKREKWNFKTVADRIRAGDANETAMFRGVLGHQRTFGNDWVNYTPEQQDQMIQAFAREGLYKSDKGDVFITDADKARKIKDEVLAGSYKAPAPVGGMVGVGQAAQPEVRGTGPAPAPAGAGGLVSLPPRSSTLSPGIDKNGNRIRY